MELKEIETWLSNRRLWGKQPVIRPMELKREQRRNLPHLTSDFPPR